MWMRPVALSVPRLPKTKALIWHALFERIHSGQSPKLKFDRLVILIVLNINNSLQFKILTSYLYCIDEQKGHIPEEAKLLQAREISSLTVRLEVEDPDSFLDDTFQGKMKNVLHLLECQVNWQIYVLENLDLLWTIALDVMLLEINKFT